MQPDIEARLKKIEQDIFDLNVEVYTNNFSASQDFNKFSSFNTRLRVPNLATLPTTCEVGEVCCVAGKLRVCSATNTWTIVGTQVV